MSTLHINGQLVAGITLGGQQVLKIKDTNGNLLYGTESATGKDLTLTYSGLDFSWSTSDGRSGAMTSGSPDYSLTIEPGQTVTFVTPGGKDRLTINGDDQCPYSPDSYTYSYTYGDFAGGEVVTCEHFMDPC